MRWVVMQLLTGAPHSPSCSDDLTEDYHSLQSTLAARLNALCGDEGQVSAALSLPIPWTLLSALRWLSVVRLCLCCSVTLDRYIALLHCFLTLLYCTGPHCCVTLGIQRLCLVIDAVNELDATHGARALRWLPVCLTNTARHRLRVHGLVVVAWACSVSWYIMR